MKDYPRLLIADKNGEIFDVPGLAATGMKGTEHFLLDPLDLIPLHADSELFLLPGRSPIGYDPDLNQYIELKENPLIEDKEPCFAVAAFLSP